MDVGQIAVFTLLVRPFIIIHSEENIHSMAIIEEEVKNFALCLKGFIGLLKTWISPIHNRWLFSMFENIYFMCSSLDKR